MACDLTKTLADGLQLSTPALEGINHVLRPRHVARSLADK